MSGKNVRAERKLEEAIEGLIAAYAEAKDREETVKDHWNIIAGVLKATREIAYGAVIATECAEANPDKHYEAWYYISSKGVVGNLARDWSSVEKNRKKAMAEVASSSAPHTQKEQKFTPTLIRTLMGLEQRVLSFYILCSH